MTVLVTGGAGHIGSHMVFELADVGERVIVLDKPSTGFDCAVAAGVPFIVRETGDQTLVERRFMIECAVKCDIRHLVLFLDRCRRRQSG